MTSVSYLQSVSPTYLENWPAALCRLSLAQVDVPLTLDEARELGCCIIECGESFGPPYVQSPPARVRDAVRAAVRKFPRGAFARLGSRSPKDSWLGHTTGFKLLDDERDPLRFFLDVSERTADDLLLALDAGYAPHIFVREWVDIPEWTELRCFMKAGKLVGISQYHYHGHYGELTGEYRGGIDWAVRHFFSWQFKPACHLQDVVFDVFVLLREFTVPHATCAWEVKLLEINPFSELTDPCLFDWRKPDDFDGSFRVVERSDADDCHEKRGNKGQADANGAAVL